MRKPLLFALAALVLAPSPASSASPYRVTELFPVEPGINAERGFAVAVAGDWLAMGAPRDDDEEKDAGAVYLFHWSGTTWDQRAKLFADRPQSGAQLGFALAMRNGLLAAGAPGEGAVYVFKEGDGVWVQERRLAEAGHGAGTFGRSLALDGDRLAVGAVGVHGETDGAVYLYKVDSWDLERPVPVRPRAPQAGERFGSAVSLAGSVLVVGAPGVDAGAVHVFQQGPTRWREKAKLIPADGGAGRQYGFAVATDGAQIFVGAPTADRENSGSVDWLVREGDSWVRRDLPEIDGLSPGDQLGFSLALSEDLLVVGAPAPPPGTGTGGIRVFRRSDASWERPLPGNAEIRDLAGFAVAVAGERVVVGGVLGDQASGAAGASWSFHCPVEAACAEEAEAVARNPRSGPRFGGSVALAAKRMVVGEPEGGSVSVYRTAGSGWRQEAWLTSPYREDGFGSSVGLTDSLLAVGAPRPRASPVSGSPEEFPDGGVDLFVRRGSSWVFEGTLAPPPMDQAFNTPAAFGISVAIADGVVAVGAPGRGAVYLFEKGAQGWNAAGVLTAPAAGFGSAISLHGGVLAIGAPGAAGGAGAAYVSAREAQGWTEPKLVLGRTGAAVVIDLPAIGSSVSVGDGFLAIGAPGFHGGLGAVYLLTGAGISWGQPIQLSALAPRRFGSSVALYENRLGSALRARVEPTRTAMIWIGRPSSSTWRASGFRAPTSMLCSRRMAMSSAPRSPSRRASWWSRALARPAETG